MVMSDHQVCSAQQMIQDDIHNIIIQCVKNDLSTRLFINLV